MLHQPEKFRDYCYTQITSLRFVVIRFSLHLSLFVLISVFDDPLLLFPRSISFNFETMKHLSRYSFHNKISSKSILATSIIISVHDGTSDLLQKSSEESSLNRTDERYIIIRIFLIPVLIGRVTDRFDLRSEDQL